MEDRDQGTDGRSGGPEDPTGPRPTASPWARAWLLVKVIEVRLRFIAILVVTGLVIGYWETLRNYWARWTRPPLSDVAEPAPDTEFFCPMHPHVVRSGPDAGGKVPKCPICGMPLSPRKKGAEAQRPTDAPTRVQLSPDRIRLAGVVTAEVAWRPLIREITTVGHVCYDESLLSTIVTRASGYMERLYVDKTFERVTRGQPLAEIYSPELFVASRELLLALGSSAVGGTVQAARHKLELLGVAAPEIDRIVSSGIAQRRVVLRSPQQGHVIRKAVVQGAHVERGATLLEVADLSTVWIEADVYEKDISFVSTGQSIEALVEAYPGRTFLGTVSLVHPHVDAATRTNTVRFVVPNEGHELRPGMWATVHLKTPLWDVEPYRSLSARARHAAAGARGPRRIPPPVEGAVLAVPESAIIDTGTAKVVYVELEPGLYEARSIKTGSRVLAHYPVLEGLAPGERVVSRGSFLVDAETRLNPAASATYVGAGGGPKSAQGGTARPAAAESRPTRASPPAAGSGAGSGAGGSSPR